jgi:hypothetical protein
VQARTAVRQHAAYKRGLAHACWPNDEDAKALAQCLNIEAWLGFADGFNQAIVGRQAQLACGFVPPRRPCNKTFT